MTVLGNFHAICIYVALELTKCACMLIHVQFLRPHGLQPTRLLCPWDFPARILEWLATPSSRDLPNPGIKLESSDLLHQQTDYLPLSHLGTLYKAHPYINYQSCSFFSFLINKCLICVNVSPYTHNKPLRYYTIPIPQIQKTDLLRSSHHKECVTRI